MNARRSIFCIVALIMPILIWVQPAKAATLRVPSQYNSIASAVSAVGYNDTILVAPGTYYSSGFHDIDFSGRDIYLLSEDGPETTILDGSNTYRIFYSQTRNWGTTVVRGFTFRNGQRLESWGLTGMVKITEGSKIYFEDMIFEGGQATNGPAVHVKGAVANFTDCIFRNNNASNKGTIYLEQGNSTLENCLFENNVAGSNIGSALFLGQGSATANGCTFQNNSGGTAYAYWNSSVSFNDCIIRDNTGGVGVVAALQNSSVLSMDNCLVNNNTASLDGAGGMVQAYGGVFDLVNSTFASNTLGGASSSVLTDTWDAATITNCIIWGTTNGAAIDRCGTVSCSLIFDNDGGDESACFNPVGDENKSSDPGFCDPSGRDFRIASNSPCLPAYSGSCGLIGATENGGCTLVATEALNFGSIKAMYR